MANQGSNMNKKLPKVVELSKEGWEGVTSVGVSTTLFGEVVLAKRLIN